MAAGSLFSSLQSVGAGAGVGVAVKAVGGAVGAGGFENRSTFGFGSFGVPSTRVQDPILASFPILVISYVYFTNSTFRNSDLLLQIVRNCLLS